jgi:hypothetical protein
MQQSGSLESGDTLFDPFGFGLDVPEIRLAGLNIGAQLSQVGLQFSDALGAAHEAPMEASAMDSVLVPAMLMPTTATTAATGFAARTVAATLLLLTTTATTTAVAAAILTLAATAAFGLPPAAATTVMVMTMATTAASLSTIASSVSAHELHSPLD